MSVQLEARNADLATVKAILEDQRARRLDLVVSSTAIRADEGNLVVADALLGLTEDGAEARFEGAFQPTAICDEKLAGRLAQPGLGQYLKNLREQGRTDLWDANVNGLLHGGGEYVGDDGPAMRWPADNRKHLVRLLQGDAGEPGVARAFMSSKYKFIESLDVLLATLLGIRDAGINPQEVGTKCDLSDRRFYMRVGVPQVFTLAPKLLDGYRTPFDGPGARERAGDISISSDWGGWTVPRALAAARAEGMGYEPGKEPVAFAGLRVSNSDTGDGSRTIAPEIHFQVCRNGLVLKAEMDRKVHLGSGMEEGQVEWSAATVEAELALITAQVKDLAQRWCSQGWLDSKVAEIEALASAPIAKPQVTVKEVCKAAGFSQSAADDILGLFIGGGQSTAGGLLNAVTAYAQITPSAEEANTAATLGMKVLEHAARIG